MLASSSSASPPVRRRPRAASLRLARPGARVASAVGHIFLGLLLSLLLAPAVVVAHPGGPGSCDAKGGHGGSSSTGDGGYTLTHTSGTLAPGARVTVTLAKPSSGQDFQGFVVYASDGTLEPGTNAGVAHNCRGGNAVGHTSRAAKSSAEAHVTLPDTAGAVTVTAQVVVTQSPNVVYQTQLQLDVPASGGGGGNDASGGGDDASGGSGTSDSGGSGTTDSGGSGTTDSGGSGTTDSGGSGTTDSGGSGNTAVSNAGAASSGAASASVSDSFAHACRVAATLFVAALATSAGR